MATKKQRREAALRKHEERMAELRQTGLEAQRKDRARRFAKELQDWEKQHTEKHSWTKRIKECPHCQLELAAAAKSPRQTQEAS